MGQLLLYLILIKVQLTVASPLSSTTYALCLLFYLLLICSFLGSVSGVGTGYPYPDAGSRPRDPASRLRIPTGFFSGWDRDQNPGWDRDSGQHRNSLIAGCPNRAGFAIFTSRPNTIRFCFFSDFWTPFFSVRVFGPLSIIFLDFISVFLEIVSLFLQFFRLPFNFGFIRLFAFGLCFNCFWT